MTRTLILLIGITIQLGLFAQDPPLQFMSYSTDDGMSSNTFFKGGAMTQDKSGYMWIGTADGLNRFDGTEFVQYLEDPADSNSIIGNVIRSLYTDHLGFIWVGTYRNGLCVIDPGTGNVRNFNSDRQNTVPYGNITKIFEDKWNRLWVAQAGFGLYLYDRSNDKFRVVRLLEDENKLKANNNFHHEVTDLVFDPKDSTYLWLSTVGGICKFNTKTFDAVFFDADPINFGGRSLHDDGQGNLWFGTWGRGLYRFEISTSVFTKFTCPDPVFAPDGAIWALDITSRADGRLFIATADEGCMIFDPNTQIFTRINAVKYQQNAPQHPSKFFRDKDGNLWITSKNEGLYCLQPQRQLFKRIPLKGNIFRVAQNPVTKDIYACANDRAAVYKVNSETLEIIDIPVVARSGKDVTGFTGISFDHLGHGYFLEWHDLYHLDKNESRLTAVEWKEWEDAKSEFGYFWSMTIDTNDHLWITAQTGGLGELDLRNESVEIHGFVADNARSMLHNFSVSEAMVDRQQRIWTCSSRGFSYYSQMTNDFENYPSPSPASDEGAGFDRICAIAEGEEGLIFLAENLNRLGKLNSSSSRSAPIEIVESTIHFPRAEVRAMVIGADKTLWIGSAIGITRIDYPYTKALHFGNTFGIGPIEDLSMTEDGHLIAGLYGEMLIIDPDKLNVTDVSPKPVLTAFKVFDKPYSNIADPDLLQSVVLDHTQNFFSFDYSAIDFSNNQDADFSYMLDGLDDDWVHAGSRQYVSYTNIGGGDYTFKVRVRNAIGQWSNQIATLDVKVVPPLSGRAWFWPLMLLLSIATIYTLYRLRIGQIRREERLKTQFNKQLAEVEMKALRAQMNPHFLFNSLNAIKYYVLKKDRHMAADYLTDFAKLIRLVLKNSAEKLIPLSREMDALKLYVQIEALRFDKQFDYNFHVDKSIEQDTTLVPPLIFQPYVENAIWHGLMHKQNGAGKLRIELISVNGALQCLIEDNGIGREKAEKVKSKSAEKQKSMGMQITKHRMDMNKILNDIDFSVLIEDLFTEYDEPCGTRVIINFHPKSIETSNS